MSDVLYVSNAEDLQRAVALLARSEFIALDTEFMRESTYYPILCLVQAATAEGIALIDPLALTDLQPLWDLLGQRHRVKVLHAARQDLEVMSQAPRSSITEIELPEGGGIPGPIFDTQLAAAFLGHSSQIGYGNLVAERLSHSLAKGHARTDWTKRPLSAEQLDYAADDVRYLVPLYEQLRDALTDTGRLEWLQEEMLKLEDPSIFRTDPQEAWRRLKGLDRLGSIQRAVAKSLAAWRETKAMKHNRPRGWILPDDALREIAERMPTSLEQLQNLRLVSAGILRKNADELLALVAQAQQAAKGEDAYEPPGKPDPDQVARVTKLMSEVRTQAERMKIASELLATRRDIEQLVYSGRAQGIGSGWRRDVIGERLLALALHS